MLPDVFIQRQPREQPVTAWGEVTSVATATTVLQVRLAGDTAAEPVASINPAYVPAVGHIVGLIRFGSRWVVVCQIGAA